MNRSQLDKRMMELGIYADYYFRKEMKLLAQLLHEDETLNCVFTGISDGNRRLVAVTDSRVAVLFAGALGAGDVKVLRREAVTAWEYEAKWPFPAVTIVAGQESLRFTAAQRGRKELFDWAMAQPVKSE